MERPIVQAEVCSPHATEALDTIHFVFLFLSATSVAFIKPMFAGSKDTYWKRKHNIIKTIAPLIKLWIEFLESIEDSKFTISLVL